MKRLFLFLLLISAVQLQAQISTDKLDQIVEQLSLEEKVYLVIGTGMDIPGMAGGESNEPQSVVGSTQDKIPGAAGTSYGNKNFDFPAVVFADGPAGIRISPERKDAPGKTFYATAFPTASSLSSSWDTELATKVGEAFGREGREYGVDFLLAPALNIHRNPLGGRNFEYYSEDPVLGGKITAAFVNGVQKEGIGATIKHFVANNSETNRTELNTVVGERALREIYLRGFKIAIEESDPWAVMSSYNKINGVYASENEELLTGILRDEWNYKGFVMTDWFAGKDPVAQMKAGNDLLMPGTDQQAQKILVAVKSGELKEEVLNRNVKNILRQYYKTPSFRKYIPSGKPDLELHKSIARSAAADGMVLLKNENALPLAGSSKVALFGVTSEETISGGTGSGDVNKAYMVPVVKGMQNAGFKIDEELALKYDQYVKEARAKIPPKKMFFEADVLVPEMKLTKEELTKIAARNSAAVFILGRTSGEFQDRKIEGDFELNAQELSLIKDISEVFRSLNKKFVVVLNIGGVIQTENWKDLADAILLSWQPGQEAGNAIADILSGKVNPSGKLPVSFPIQLEDLASTKNFPGQVLDPSAPKSQNPLVGIPSKEVYEEGIYIGYRYFDTFDVPVSYPFGFGLSYTNFNFSDLEITKEGDEYVVEVLVKNTGKTKGKQVVQLYVESPEGSVEKPEKELKAFAKTQLLQPGESQKLLMRIKEDHLAYFDTATSSWKLDKGNYGFIVGVSSEDEKLREEKELEGKIISKTGRKIGLKEEIRELSIRN